MFNKINKLQISSYKLVKLAIFRGAHKWASIIGQCAKWLPRLHRPNVSASHCLNARRVALQCHRRHLRQSRCNKSIQTHALFRRLNSKISVLFRRNAHLKPAAV